MSFHLLLYLCCIKVSSLLDTYTGQAVLDSYCSNIDLLGSAEKFYKEKVHSLKWCILCSVNGEEVLCVKSDLWLTKQGESEGKFFFRLLQPSAP